MKTNRLPQDLLPLFQKSKVSFLGGQSQAYRKNIQLSLDVASSIDWETYAFSSSFIQIALGSHCPQVASLILRSLPQPLESIDGFHSSVWAPLNKAMLQNICVRFSSSLSSEAHPDLQQDTHDEIFEDEWQALQAFCDDVISKKIPLSYSLENYLGEVVTKWTNWCEDMPKSQSSPPQDLKWYMEWLYHAGANPSSGYRYLQRMIPDYKLQDQNPLFKILQEFCVEAEKGLIVEALEKHAGSPLQSRNVLKNNSPSPTRKM